MTRGTLSLIAIAIAMVVLLAPASAVADRAGSKVSIDHFDDTGSDIRWAGKVKSPRHQCEVGRTVVLWFVGPGDERNKAGQDKTDEKGRWIIHTPFTLASSAYAKVKPRKLPNGLRCGGNRSATFPLENRPAPRAAVQANLTIIASQINPDVEEPAQIDFNGKLQSTPKCRKGRRISVFKVRPGKDLKVGSGKSNRRGKWYVPGEVPGTNNSNGTYYAKTPRVKKGDTVCAGDKSANHVADQQKPRARGQTQRVTTTVELWGAGPTDPTPVRAHRRSVTHYRFYGRIFSAQAKCTKLRRLTLYNALPGEDRKLETGASDTLGYFSINVDTLDLDSGTVYAKAPKAKRGRTVCKGDRSENITL